MDKYWSLAADLIYSFNGILFVWMSILWLRNYRRRRSEWGGWPYGALLVCCAVLYLDRLARDLAFALLRRPATVARTIEMAIGPVVFIVLLHRFYHNERDYLPGRRYWRNCMVLLYGLAGTLAAAACIDPVMVKHSPWRMLLIGAAAVGSAAMLILSRRHPPGLLQSRQRYWLISLCSGSAALAAWTLATRSKWVELSMDLIPLCFLFVATYYIEKFTLFDILIKRGTFAFAALLVLTIYFVFLTPWIFLLAAPLKNTAVGSLLWACSLLPIVLLSPWASRRLSDWLDRLWLGRKFPAAEAGRYFLMGMQGAVGADELIERATDRLKAIFRSDVEVHIEGAAPSVRANDGETIQAPIRIRESVVGKVIVRRREHGVRFLSEDVALLASLTEAFSSLLENVRLREKKLLQEQRERELLLHANRAELKALRAQVNPHFLFNTLNTVAGLIRVDPDRAERTIEQLAEVFRYTLRRSDREWVRVEDELEAVGAYLDIEQTRFRERLKVRIDCAEAARNWRIPTMVIQTLVENAIKHGVGAISAPGVLEIEIGVAGSGLRLEVRDNGPGFQETASRARQASQGGYGLHNIRERLRGHFGDAACLSIGRDVERGMTTVRVELPPPLVTHAEAGLAASGGGNL